MAGNSHIPENIFIETFEKYGPQETSRRLGVTLRKIYERRVNIEKRTGVDIKGPDPRTRVQPEYEGRLRLNIDNGTVLVFSDAHYWPGIVTTAHRGLVHLAKKIKPTAIVANGDILDGASISRHAPIGWESRPSLIQEIEACQDRLDEIMKACPKARRLWTLGNHDARLETRIATVAPEFAKVHGVHLKDHFSMWEPAWSVWLNDDTVIKHRYKGGIHATHNNVVNSGKTIVTGHLHSLKVTPFDDYNGTRWGVDTGTLAEPFGPQFQGYMEDNPRNWRSGFAVLTCVGGKLMWPELVPVVDETHIYFRGELIEV